MCHMFLVPVFETESLRTFLLSPYRKAGAEEDTKKKEKERKDKERERWEQEGCQEREIDG